MLRNLFFTILFFTFSALAKEVQLERKLIKAGAKLYSAANEVYNVLDESRIFYVSFEYHQKPPMVDIYSKEKKFLFRTKIENIQDIEDIVTIEPKVRADSIYKKITSLQTADSEFKLAIKPTFGFENTDLSKLSNLYATNLETASGNRFDLRVIFPSSLGVNFGLDVNFHTLIWGNEKEEIHFNGLNAGPYLQIPMTDWEWVKLNAILGAELSIFANGTSDLYIDRFTKTVWHLGFEQVYPTSIGEFTSEFFYRKQDLVLKSTGRSVNRKAEEFNINTYGVSVGYQWEFKL